MRIRKRDAACELRLISSILGGFHRFTFPIHPHLVIVISRSPSRLPSLYILETIESIHPIARLPQPEGDLPANLQETNRTLTGPCTDSSPQRACSRISRITNGMRSLRSWTSASSICVGSRLHICEAK
ncbi:hypothetical protein U1Q18_051462 [Sarracenia purpurea var. burkii]